MKMVAALLCLAASAAQVVDIRWPPEGRFAHETTLAHKKVLESCGKLPGGQPRGLVLRGRHGTPFNIHVHQGKEVFYPARLENAERAQGLQTFDAEPAHCWMWTNKTTEAVKVKIELQRQAR